MIRYENFIWTPLEHTHLMDCIRDLDDPVFTQAALRKYPDMTLHDLMVYRYRSSQDGERLHLLIRDMKGRARGWVGLLPCPSDPQTLETSIYLHPMLWGTSASKHGYTMLHCLGQIFGYNHLVASIDVDNIRSVKARTKLYPKAQQKRIFEPEKNRWSINFYIHSYPDGATEIDPKLHREITRITQSLASYARLSRANHVN